MKHLKSSLKDLHRLFDRSVTARHLAEPFVSFDGPRQATEVLTFMEEKDFDVVGVRWNGQLVGYVNRDELTGGTLDNHLRPFEGAIVKSCV